MSSSNLFFCWNLIINITVASLTQSHSCNFSRYFLDKWRQEEGTTGQMGQSNKKSTAELLRAASNTFIRLCDAAGRTDPAWQQREAQPHRKEATRGYVAKTKTSSQRHICVTFSQDSREEDHRRHPQPTGPLSTQQHGHNAEFWLKLLPPCFRLTMLKKAGGAVGWPKHQVWLKKKKKTLRKTCWCDGTVSEIKDYARNLNVQIKDWLWFLVMWPFWTPSFVEVWEAQAI